MAGYQVIIGLALCLSLIATPLADAKRKKRIVNGKKAADSAYPIMVSVQGKVSEGNWYHFCGGAVIARDKVLTAAHCLIGKRSADIRIAVGYNDLYAPPNVHSRIVRVKSFVVHEGYHGNDNDLAMLYLSETLYLSTGVQIAKLAPNGTSFENTKCVLAGYGWISYDGYKSGHLMEAKVSVISPSQCRASFPKHNLGAKHMCAAEAFGIHGYNRASGCMGDSGGPLMCGSKLEYLAGLLSFGMKTCEGNFPSVYTRVSEFLEWIASH